MSYQKLTPIIAKGATEPRYLENRFADLINVKDFGAVGDGETDDTEAFQAAAEAAENTHGVFVPFGTYLVSSAITQNALWVLSPKATIVGLDSIPSSNPILQDTSRLKGNVIHFNGKLNRVGDPTLCIGSSSHWLTKNWKYVSEVLPKLNVSADDGMPSGYFSTYVKDNSIRALGFSVGMTVVNDDHVTRNPSWSYYCEGIRAAPDENGNEAGHVFNCEMDMINMGNTGILGPSGGDSRDWTVGLWISCGGGSSAPYGSSRPSKSKLRCSRLLRCHWHHA